MIKNVRIETVSPKQMRYRTVGDWFFAAEGYLVIQVADTGNWVYNILIAIHELVEVVLCCKDGVTQKQVDKFDLAHQDDEDPGSHPKAPYHDQHMTALGVEILVATKAGVRWRNYEDRLDKVYYSIRKRRGAVA